MAMVSLDHSRQFSITMYLVNLVAAAWSLSSYKGYRRARSIAGSLARILKKAFVRLIRCRCTVNSHRKFNDLTPSSRYRPDSEQHWQLIRDALGPPCLFR